MIRARVLELLSHEAFLALVDGHCMKEQPIAFSGQMKQIDLLVEREDEIVVIDYKSSKKEQKAHLDQVRGYKEAMGHISEKTVLGYLCYLREEGVVLVEV
jgi:exodeoxyribonuclease V beta subunit